MARTYREYERNNHHHDRGNLPHNNTANHAKLPELTAAHTRRIATLAGDYFEKTSQLVRNDV